MSVKPKLRPTTTPARAPAPAAARASNRPRARFATATSDSITGTSISTPTTVARAAHDCRPNRLMATATASSKKLDVPIIAAGAAMSWRMRTTHASP
jgi:hypothetical protein